MTRSGRISRWRTARRPKCITGRIPGVLGGNAMLPRRAASESPAKIGSRIGSLKPKDRAVHLYLKKPHPWSKQWGPLQWSLVDCLSIIACQDRGIQEVFTGDHHFEQAGLRILLRKDG